MGGGGRQTGGRRGGGSLSIPAWMDCGFGVGCERVLGCLYCGVRSRARARDGVGVGDMPLFFSCFLGGGVFVFMLFVFVAAEIQR